MPSQGLPRIAAAATGARAASVQLQQRTETCVAPPVYRPQPAASSVPRSGFGAAPPTYRPGVPDARSNRFTLQRRIQGSSVSAQSPRIQLSAPPVYRPTQTTYQLKTDVRPTAGRMQVSTVQRASLPAALVARQMRGQMLGTIQRAVMDKAQLEKMYNDAMSGADFDTADKIEKQLASLPGDSMPKTFGVSDEDSRDLVYKGKQVRFSFVAGLRAKLTATQTTGGKLKCALGTSCYVDSINYEIKVNSSGKEVWTSASGNTHETAPPIDHYSPDWKDRLAALEKKNYDVATFAVKGKELYNAMPLRIIHMVCNSKRNGS